jgi:hypothetical protein
MDPARRPPARRVPPALPLLALLTLFAPGAFSAPAGQSPEPPEFNYRRVELRYCEILSTASWDTLARFVALPDEMFEAVAAILAGDADVVPRASLEKLAAPPLTVRIFESRDDFQRYASADRPQFVQFGAYSTSRQIVMWLQRSQALDARRLAHEMLHAVLERSVPDAPWWLHEGLARDFSSFQYRPLNYRYSPFLPRETLHMLGSEKEGDWIPLARLLVLRPRDLYAEKDDEDSDEKRSYRALAYAEAWALVYYIRRERSLKREGAFGAYLDRLREGYPSLGAFREVFGGDLGRFERAWVAQMKDWYREHQARMRPVQ